MSIYFEVIITIIAAMVIAIVLYKFYVFMLTPVKCGKDTDICIVVRVDAKCHDIGQTINELVWLGRSGALKSRAIIVDCGIEQSCREMAEMMIERHSEISICDISELEMILEMRNE